MFPPVRGSAEDTTTGMLAAGPARKDHAASHSNPAYGFRGYFRPQSTLAAPRMRIRQAVPGSEVSQLGSQTPAIVPLYPVGIPSESRCHAHKSMERRPASIRGFLRPMVRLVR